MTGAVTSGVSSAAFYGGSKALETLKGSIKESRVFAWTKQPTKRQASIAGIGKEAQTVLRFQTNASFEPDVGNATKSIADMVVQTTDGQKVPISISEVESVGFKKEWWQIWRR